MRVYDGVERTAPGGLLDRRTGDLANGALSDVESLEWFYAHTGPGTVHDRGEADIAHHQAAVQREEGALGWVAGTPLAG